MSKTSSNWDLLGEKPINVDFRYCTFQESLHQHQKSASQSYSLQTAHIGVFHSIKSFFKIQFQKKRVGLLWRTTQSWISHAKETFSKMNLPRMKPICCGLIICLQCGLSLLASSLEMSLYTIDNIVSGLQSSSLLLYAFLGTSFMTPVFVV